MKRLTAWNNGHAYFPECFKEPCSGCRYAMGNCDFLESVCRRLAEYEDTGHTPSMIMSLKKSEVNAHKTAVQNAMKLADYEKIGTLEECQEAVERQKTKKPDDHSSCAEKTHYKCPECGYIMLTVYASGYRLGNKTNHCEKCGQAIDWSE